MNIDTTTPQITLTIDSEGVENYNNLLNKPQINGVTLTGNLTTEDLGIVTEEENWELVNTDDFTETEKSIITFDRDSNNLPFELKKYKLIITLNESNGNRWHLKINNLGNLGMYYMNASAVALYKYGLPVIIEPIKGFNCIEDINNTCPPPTVMYGSNFNPQWLNFYTYNNANNIKKEDLYPINKLIIELQNSVKGIIYLYGIRN